MSGYQQANHVIHLAGGKLQPGTVVPEIVKRALADTPAAGIIINAHGGLVSEKDARAVAQFKLYPHHVDWHTYPMYFVWETGPWEAPLNNLKEVLKAISKKLLFEWAMGKLEAKVSDLADNALVAEEDLEEGVLAKEWAENGEDPLLDAALAQAWVDYQQAKSEPALAAESGSHVPYIDTKQGAAINDRVAAELFGEPLAADMAMIGLRGWLQLARVFIRVVKRQRSGRGRRHVPVGILFEELLREFYLGDLIRIGWWKQMQGDAEQSFNAPGAGGRELMKALGEALKGVHPQPRITLVGHSAGSIFHCHLLDIAGEVAKDLVFDVVFLAPAVTCERFAQAIHRHASGAKPRIRRYRQLGMRDASEAGEWSTVFPGSLLYLVSNVLEDERRADVPLMGMERFFSWPVYASVPEAAAIKACADFLHAQGSDSAQWLEQSDLAGVDPKTKLVHGYFDDGKVALQKLERIMEGLAG